MTAYYNEINPYAAQWVRNLIAEGAVAPGIVDERSIVDVQPGDLKGFTQCHFFAGIGVWSYALRMAGWPDNEPVWTGSCPCQPFSSAGLRKGHEDERNLWPEFYRLIRECRPPIIFGEQVSSSDVIGPTSGVLKDPGSPAWLDVIQADLERAHYATGAVVANAACVGAPHERERLYWMADANSSSDNGCWLIGPRGRLEHPNGGVPSLVGDSDHAGLEGRGIGRNGADEWALGTPSLAEQRPGPTNGAWSLADWLFCTDGKWRSTQPGSLPLVDRLTVDMGSLFPDGTHPFRTGGPWAKGMIEGYGNAIVAPLAEMFIRAYMSIR